MTALGSAARSVVLAAALGGCAASRADPGPDALCRGLDGRPMLTARLLLGARRGDGGQVTKAAWRRFLDRHVTPRFPEGLSVFEGHGRWRAPDGRHQEERTRLLLIVMPDTPQALAALRAVRADYAEAFAQQSVGLVLDRSCATFE